MIKNLENIVILGLNALLPFFIMYFSKDIVIGLFYIGVTIPLWFIYYQVKQHTQILRRWLKL